MALADATTLFLTNSMKQLRQDNIISKILGVKLLTDKDRSNDLIGAGLLTNNDTAIEAGVIQKII